MVEQETLKDLSRELHRRGMCLIIDIVANHVRQMTVRPDYSEGGAVGSKDPWDMLWSTYKYVFYNYTLYIPGTSRVCTF